MSRLFHNTKPEAIALKPDCTLLRLPLVRQATDYTCGVACIQSVIRYAGYDFDIREEKLAEILKSNPQDGTNTRDMVEYLNSVRYSAEEKSDDMIAREGVQVFKAEAKDNLSLEQLISFIDEGKPVICAIQAWGNMEDYSEEMEEGHYVIAIGYDTDNIIFMDPSTSGAYTYIPKEEFLIRWHDYDKFIKLNHFGIVVTLEPDYDQLKIYKIK